MLIMILFVIGCFGFMYKYAHHQMKFVTFALYLVGWYSVAMLAFEVNISGSSSQDTQELTQLMKTFNQKT